MDETLPDSDTSDNFPQKPITSGVILRSAEGLDLIPGNIELAGMEVSMVNLIGRENLLRQITNELRSSYDYSSEVNHNMYGG